MGNEPLRVVGYVRVSTKEQADDGVSLLAQAQRVRDYCRLYQLDLVCVLSDPGESGANLRRPGLTEALGMLDSGAADGLVVAKLDRLSRSILDWSSLIERYFADGRRCRLFSVGDSIDTRTATGRLMLNLLVSVAQWERERIVERTVEALDHKRAAGERIGTVPYGWTVGADGKTLDTVPDEQRVIRVIMTRIDEGFYFRAIAAELTRRGILTKKGRRLWSPAAVRSIFSRHKREEQDP
jgi:DNA invertase Pin-like site-specific DNA recombinase